MMPAIVARRPKRPTARRLFAFDRDLGVRFVAGADEAGRGCLAGPLVAAAVLFDYERLGLREARALSALNDSKQPDPEARPALHPLRLRAARPRSERALEVLEGDEPAAGVDGHADRVEAQLGGMRSVRPLGQPLPRHRAHPGPLDAPQRVPRPPGAGAPRLDLAEHQPD